MNKLLVNSQGKAMSVNGMALVMSEPPRFYERLIFDGSARIDTGIVLPENCSFLVNLGGESSKVPQEVFMASQDSPSGHTGMIIGGATDSTRRELVPYYDSSNYSSIYFEPFVTTTYDYFQTPSRAGHGSFVTTYTKGSVHPSGTLRLGYWYNTAYTGVMGTFRIYGSDAQDCTKANDFANHSPLYTLRPCLYNGEAGMWIEETGSFVGNSANVGNLSVQGEVYDGLPTGYTRLEYVQTNSLALIDTGVAGATDLTISVKFLWSNYIQYGAVFGNYISESNKVNRAILASSTQLYVAGGNNLAEAVSGSGANVIHELTVTGGCATLDGTTTTVYTSNQSANSTNIALGSNRVTNGANRDIGLRLYDFKIEKNGRVLLHYIPCKRDSDSKAGFWDIQNDAFKPSDTATDFVAGPEYND